MTDFSAAKTLVDEKERVSLGKSTDGALVPAPLEPRYREIAKLGEASSSRCAACAGARSASTGRATSRSGGTRSSRP